MTDSFPAALGHELTYICSACHRELRDLPGLRHLHVVADHMHKARIGWWVKGRWCPTRAIRNHQIDLVTKGRR